MAPKKCQQVNRSPINFFMHYITLFHLRLFETSLRFLQISSLNCKLLPRSTRSLIACLPSSLHIHYCIHHLKINAEKSSRTYSSFQSSILSNVHCLDSAHCIQQHIHCQGYETSPQDLCSTHQSTCESGGYG